MLEKALSTKHFTQGSTLVPCHACTSHFGSSTYSQVFCVIRMQIANRKVWKICVRFRNKYYFFKHQTQSFSYWRQFSFSAKFFFSFEHKKPKSLIVMFLDIGHIAMQINGFVAGLLKIKIWSHSHIQIFTRKRDFRPSAVNINSLWTFPDTSNLFFDKLVQDI